jgi:hypothetical protein
VTERDKWWGRLIEREREREIIGERDRGEERMGQKAWEIDDGERERGVERERER